MHLKWSGVANFRAQFDAPGEINASGARMRAVEGIGVTFSGANLKEADLRQAILNSSHFHQADLRQADLRGASLYYCPFGTQAEPTRLDRARFAGCNVEGGRGYVSGAVDVCDDATPKLVGGADLEQWFRAHGAPDVRVIADEGGGTSVER
jgi:uncharacterized protein YjbI with pentapeptide repeats